MSDKRTVNMVLCAFFAALIIIGSFLKIPFYPVPLVLQVEFVMLAGLLLGAKWGTLSTVVFIALGLIGLPVFTNGGGIGYVFQPTFGYMIGYVIGAFVIGAAAYRTGKLSYVRCLCACLAGTAVIYAVGLVYLYLIMNLYLGKDMGIWKIMSVGLFSTAPKDIVFCFLLPMLSMRLVPIVKKVK